MFFQIETNCWCHAWHWKERLCSPVKLCKQEIASDPSDTDDLKRQLVRVVPLVWRVHGELDSNCDHDRISEWAETRTIRQSACHCKQSMPPVLNCPSWQWIRASAFHWIDGAAIYGRDEQGRCRKGFISLCQNGTRLLAWHWKSVLCVAWERLVSHDPVRNRSSAMQFQIPAFVFWILKPAYCIHMKNTKWTNVGKLLWTGRVRSTRQRCSVKPRDIRERYSAFTEQHLRGIGPFWRLGIFKQNWPVEQSLAWKSSADIWGRIVKPSTDAGGTIRRQDAKFRQNLAI